MVRIIDSLQYDKCESCGRTSYELLRVFEIGPIPTKKTPILTLCTNCLGELEKLALLYQPKEAIFLRRI